MTDAGGYTTRNEYDAMMHLSRTIDPLGAQTRFGYDAVGNQIWTEDALGRRTHRVYDGLAIAFEQKPTVSLSQRNRKE